MFQATVPSQSVIMTVIESLGMPKLHHQTGRIAKIGET
jgi:hypothetical protein